jgi:plasmid stabilization system protein ParE
VIAYSEEALDDLERISEFNSGRDPASALEHVQVVRDAVTILERHPQIGRPIAGGESLRELIVSFGVTGYVTLYERESSPCP